MYTARLTKRCYGKGAKFFKVYRAILHVRIQTEDDLILSMDMKQLGIGIGNWDIVLGGAGGLELKHKIQDPVIMGFPKFEPRPWQLLISCII